MNVSQISTLELKGWGTRGRNEQMNEQILQLRMQRILKASHYHSTEHFKKRFGKDIHLYIMHEAGLFSMQIMGLINHQKVWICTRARLKSPINQLGKLMKKVRHHLGAVFFIWVNRKRTHQCISGFTIKASQPNPRKGRCPQVCFIILRHPSSLATMTVAVFEKGKGEYSQRISAPRRGSARQRSAAGDDGLPRKKRCILSQHKLCTLKVMMF